eukprot:TRINITY_DN18535_c0_g1_i1.p1 TRINITY_DN18535_c0_g1~~TRINITY_DN18535_c0_g1_i1.p1  ORF type:complete len:443 (+),score=101.44 TRINITY_DN18535_c0_g1_i1:70-1329(+)
MASAGAAHAPTQNAPSRPRTVCGHCLAHMTEARVQLHRGNLVRALWDWDKEHIDQLTFDRGDVIRVLDENEGGRYGPAGWQIGELDKQCGWFPMSLVEPYHPPPVVPSAAELDNLKRLKHLKARWCGLKRKHRYEESDRLRKEIRSVFNVVAEDSWCDEIPYEVSMQALRYHELQAEETGPQSIPLPTNALRTQGTATVTATATPVPGTPLGVPAAGVASAQQVAAPAAAAADKSSAPGDRGDPAEPPRSKRRPPPPPSVPVPDKWQQGQQGQEGKAGKDGKDGKDEKLADTPREGAAAPASTAAAPSAALPLPSAESSWRVPMRRPDGSYDVDKIQSVLEHRQHLRRLKKFNEADSIRLHMLREGVEVRDRTLSWLAHDGQRGRFASKTAGPTPSVSDEAAYHGMVSLPPVQPLPGSG